MDEFMQAAIEEAKKTSVCRRAMMQVALGRCALPNVILAESDFALSKKGHDYARPRSTSHACTIWSRETS